MECLAMSRKQWLTFNHCLPPTKIIYSKWIEGAKTDFTKTKRIAIVVNGWQKNEFS